MKVCMYYDNNRALIGDFAAARARQYCDQHGYALVVKKQWSANLCPYMERLKFIRDEISGDGIFWMDADVWINDLKPTVYDLFAGAPITFCQDNHGLCAGVMLIQNCDEAKQLMDTWIFLGMMKDRQAFGGDQRDQATIKLLMQNFSNVDKIVGLMNRDAISDQEYTGKKPFAHHFWATNKDQAAVLKAMKARAI